MGNENKVKDKLIDVKSRFLPADIGDPGGKSEVYALDTEFARAAKNRSWTFYLIVFGFLAAIVVATLVITTFVQGKHNQVELAIMEFEEIKLKDILSATRNDQKSLDIARREVDTLRVQYREALAALKEKAENDRLALRAAGLSDSDRRSREQQISRALETDTARTRREYEGKISTQQKTVADYESKVNARQREMSEGVAKVENILSNHERLMKLRLDKQQAEYEKKIADLILRYNPHFTEADLRRMIAQEKGAKAVKTPPAEAIIGDLIKDKISTAARVDKLRAEQAEQKKLIARLRQVPYINSVSPALSGIDRRNAEINAEYEALLTETIRVLRRKNEILGNYRAALKELTDREREYGYVIDARKPAKMRVYLNPSLRAKPGLRASVFRKDDEYIADIEILFDSEGPYARVISSSEGKSIGAFDKIYLEDR